GVQALDRGARRSRGHEKAEPEREVIAPQPGLLRARDAGNRGRGIPGRNGQCAQAPGADEAHHRGRGGEVDLRIAREQRLRRRPTNSCAMLPPAPGLFSTTTATPSSLPSSSAAIRVRKSPEPPGG